MRAMTWPTVTVSPSSARISVIVPAAGAGSSTSTLSVEISTIGLVVLDGVADLDRPLEDRALGDRLAARGRDDVDDLAGGASVPSARGAAPSRLAVGRGAGGASPAPAGAAPFAAAISASTAPTVTVSPSAAWIFTTVPLAGEGTSASTLSVEISTSDLVGLDGVALLLVPLEDGALGHRLAHLRAG